MLPFRNPPKNKEEKKEMKGRMEKKHEAISLVHVSSRGLPHQHYSLIRSDVTWFFGWYKHVDVFESYSDFNKKIIPNENTCLNAFKPWIASLGWMEAEKFGGLTQF